MRKLSNAAERRDNAVMVGPTEPGDARVRSEVERLLGGPLDAKRLGRLGEALKLLHDRFVSENTPETAPVYFDAKLAAAAYLAYFHDASAAQVRRTLADLDASSTELLPSELRVLDVGAGTGGASEGVRRFAESLGKSARITMLEPGSVARESAPRVFRGEPSKLEVRAWKAGDAIPDGPFDVIVASHMLNELFASDLARLDARTAFAQSLANRLTPNGLLVLVEPALKRTGRELLVIRDRLLQQTKLAALAPCLFQGACPAIQRPRDWCHADRPWTPTELVVEAGAAAGLERDTLKYTAVVFGRRHPAPEKTKDVATFRIVSSRLEEKGKSRYFGCGPSGRHALVRLDKSSTGENAAFDSFERGDLVRLGRLVPSGDGKRVEADTSVVVERRARELD